MVNRSGHGELYAGVSVKKLQAQIACPDFGFGPIPGGFSRGRILPKNGFVSREFFYFLNSRKKSFADWNVFWARLSVFRAEQANQRFSTSAPTGPWKRELGIV